MTRWVRDNGLTLILPRLFAGSIVGQWGRDGRLPPKTRRATARLR